MKFGPKSRWSSNPTVWRSVLAGLFAFAAGAFGAGSASAADAAKPPETTPKSKKPAPAARRSAPAKAQSSKAKPPSKRSTHAAAKAKGKPKSKRAFRNPRRSAPLGPPDSPAIRYGALDSGACLRELRNRGIAFREESRAPGVSTPVRLLGPLGGVLYRTDLSERERKSAPWEIYDCRLVLSLHDFSEILSKHGISEVRIFSAYRPPPKKASEQASKRHQAALAVDVRTLRKESGAELTVLKDFEQKLGSDPCSEASEPSDPAAKELKSIACEAARAHLFNSILTPNFDEAHRNHFHLEVTPGKGWFLLR